MYQENILRMADALLKLNTREEMLSFLDDLCTIQELKSMAQRYEVAELLEKKLTYAVISEQTGASTATISRVNRALVYGADGYKTVLERMKKEEEQA